MIKSLVKQLQPNYLYPQTSGSILRSETGCTQRQMPNLVQLNFLLPQSYSETTPFRSCPTRRDLLFDVGHTLSLGFTGLTGLTTAQITVLQVSTVHICNKWAG